MANKNGSRSKLGIHSVRVKVLSLLLLVSIIPLACVTYIVLLQSETAMDNMTEEALHEIAELNATILNNFIHGKVIALETLIQEVPVFREAKVDAILPYLYALDASDPDILKASFISRNGELRNTLGEIVDASNFTNFQKVKEEKVLHISGIRNDSITGNKIVIIDQPIVNTNGEFLGLIQSIIDPTMIGEVVDQIRYKENGYGIMISGDGTVIAHPDQDLLGTNITESLHGEINESFLHTMFENTQGHGNIIVNEQPFTASFSTLEETGWKIIVSAPDSEVHHEARQLMKTALIIIVVSIVIVIGIAYMLSNVMLKPIREISSFIERAATGDLTSRLSEKGKDEISMLKRNVNHMLHSFNIMLNKISDSIETVAASSEQLTASATQSTTTSEKVSQMTISVSEGTASQHESAVQMSQATEEMAIGVSKIAHSAAEVSEFTNKVTQEIKQGHESASKASKQMQLTSTTVKNSASIIKSLQEKSQKIQDIIGVISNISDQTNLLSLNASIEAARAGEHGRGFAVVAGEVKKLADQTGHSVIEVEEIIKDMIQVVHQADNSMEAGLTEVAEGAKQVMLVGATFDKILEAIEQVNNQIQEVSAIAEEISAGTEEVSASADGMVKINKDTSDRLITVAQNMQVQLETMKEISASAESLSHMATDLQQVAAQFKINK